MEYMQPHTILVLIIAITTISYVSGQLLDYLNLKAQRTTLPDEIAAFYDREKYLTSLAYHRELTRFSFLTDALSFGVSLGMLLLGGFGWLDAQLRPLFSNEIILALVFFGVIVLASDILTLPFQWYSTFVIEEKYGFNKTTVQTFILDKLKGYLLGALVGGALLAALIYLVQLLGPSFWLWFAALAAVFVLFMNLFYTSLILPLYNKLTPLPEGSLKTAIEAFARKVDFPLDNIFVIDGSKRSSKANAFFSGIGKKKKIVLYDTLIQQHTEEELVAVLAHEVGHFKKKHIVWSLVLAVVQIFFTLYVLSWMISSEALSLALGGSQQAIHLNLIAFATLFSPVSAVTGVLMSIYSRSSRPMPMRARLMTARH
jgi:STE24 endopeptidase